MLEWQVDELSAESAARPFDCVVVGGGSAGLTTTRTLAEAGQRVALLEAGPAPFLTHSANTELRFTRALSDNLRNQVQYGPRLPNGDTFGPNFSCLGGRGLFWNGAAPRFRAHDFAGWPITLAELEPYYQWAEREFRVTRRIGESRLGSALVSALRDAGFAAEPAPFAADVRPAGEGQLGAGIASGLGAFLRAAGATVAGDGIRVAMGAVAMRVEVSDGVAHGVLAASSRGDPTPIRARAVVLAAGGVESVRLAALSGLPDPAGRIGRGIQDHLFLRYYVDAPHQYVADAPEAAAVYVPASAQDAEQWEIHAPGRRLFSLDDGSAWAPEASEAYQFMVRSFAATDKRDDNRVEARPGPLGSATVHFAYTAADEHRKQAMRERGARLVAALDGTPREERFAAPGGSYHEAGGLDMGTDPATSVTDGDGRFHAVPNLVCTDAAAFPRIGATNPHLTIVAVARRQAERLAARLA